MDVRIVVSGPSRAVSTSVTPEFARISVLWGPLVALGIFLVFALLALVVNGIFKLAINQRKSRHPEGLDTLIMGSLKGPVTLFIIIFGFLLWFTALTRITHPAFGFLQGLDDEARSVWLVIVILEVSFTINHVLQAGLR